MTPGGFKPRVCAGCGGARGVTFFLGEPWHPGCYRRDLKARVRRDRELAEQKAERLKKTSSELKIPLDRTGGQE